MAKTMELPDAPSVAILILNWNGWEDTIECLESIHRINYPNFYTIVIDNGSSNESVEKIKEYAKGKITVKSKYLKYTTKNKPIEILEHTRATSENAAKKMKGAAKNSNDLEDTSFFNSDQNRKMVLIKNEKNYGFAEGNNIGIRYAINTLNSDYVLLLNNDTVVELDFLTKMVKAAENDKKIGIVGAKIPYYDKPKKNWFCRGVINWFSINIAYHDCECKSEKIETDYITGCVALIRNEVIKKVGYLDKSLFLYFEDADFSLRVKKNGFGLIVIPEAVVYHKVSATSYTFILSTAQYYFSRNRIWFVKKYCPKRYLPISKLFIISRLFLAVGFFTLKRKGDTVSALLKAYRDGFKGSY